MPTNEHSESHDKTGAPLDPPRCVSIFDAGIENSRELTRGLSALMGDLAASRVEPGRANAICNAAGKILTTVNLAYKFGLKAGDAGSPYLSLSSGEDEPPRVPRPGSTSGRSIQPPRTRAR